MRSSYGRPRAAHEDVGPDAEDYLSRTVFESEPRVLFTGLLYPDGEPVLRYEHKDPIGFIHWDEMYQ